MTRAEESPWKLGGLPMKELAARVWKEYWEDEVSDRAAALSYYFLFALFPALLFLTTLLGLLPIEGLMDRFMGYVAQAMPGDAVSIIRKTLDEIVAGASGGLLSIGVLAALWAGSNGMASVITALNIAYDTVDTRPWWKRRLVAITLTLGFSAFIMAALVLMVFGPKLGGVVAAWLGLGELFKLVWNIVSIPVVMLLVLVGLAIVYYFAPAVDQPWRWVTPGAVTALLLWLGMSYGLRLYVQNFGSYGATYGLIAGVILLMLWLYLTGIALLLGAEINAEIAQAAARRGGSLPHRPSAPRPVPRPGERGRAPPALVSSGRRPSG